MPSTFFRSLAALCSAAVASSVWAHDTWIIPSSFQAPAGQAVVATMSAGDGLVPLSAPKRTRVHSVDLIDVKGRQSFKDWKDQDDKQVQISFGAPAPGVSLLAVTTKDRETVIEPNKVDMYLAEIHARPAIIDAWARQRARGEEWKEKYAKDAKTYLRTGDGDAGWPQLATLGQELEIVPAQNPTRLKKGDRLAVVLQHKGKPLQDVALRLYVGPKEEKVVRTDAQGRATFELARGGPHLLATTLLNMPEKPGAVWTSRFATMGFSVPE
jgi:uncharacterized GH25 family protein